MIDFIQDGPFAAHERMRRREDDVALEFPSSVSSRARGLNALKAQNWRAAKGGNMVEYTCTAGANNNGETYDWVNSLGLGPTFCLTLSEGQTVAQNYAMVGFFQVDGSAYAVRTYGGTSFAGGSLQSGQTAGYYKIAPGTKFVGFPMAVSG